MAREADDKAFLGRGWAFPVRLAADGEIALAAYEDDVREAVRIILGTIQGERAMRPDFGAGLHALVFEPLNTTTMALVRHRVEEALVIWEPRIDHITVQLTAEPTQGRTEAAERLDQLFPPRRACQRPSRSRPFSSSAAISLKASPA